MSAASGFRPERAIADLRELDELTGGTHGASRVAWTPGWLRARDWLAGKLAELPCKVTLDPAGNLLADLSGKAPVFLAVGSHLDSVPNGGWLDGVLGVLAGLELLRAHSADAMPAVGLRLIDWADEEGARFGRSLFGSSAATGVLDPHSSAGWTDASGTTLAEAMAACGLDVASAGAATGSLQGVEGYIELHIEQGPVLERGGHQLAVVSGTVGVQRNVLRLFGESLHAGAAPMDMRHDPVLLAAAVITAVAERARAAGATATFGSVNVSPGVVTIVPERCEIVIDIRHPDRTVLERLVAENEADVARRAAAAGIRALWETQWAIEPIPFHPELIAAARQGCLELGVEPFLMPSGALHDAAVVAKVRPVVMLFTPSRRGISHSPEEDTAEPDLIAGLRAFELTARHALGWLAGRA